MSHELRTPLNSILALTRLLLNRTDGDLSGEQEKQVTFIRNSAQDLADLVNDLLDLAKVEAGRIDVKVTTFEVSELFGALRGMFRPLVREGVTLFIEEPAGIPPLESDESKVAQILRNFISNALKFTEHGEVRVSARFDTRTECVLFSVRDTGIGIALKDHETIFHEFTQVQNPVQERVRGTGLGLPLSRKLAELLGGNVHLTSELGKGSKFSAEIPRVYGHRAGAARQSLERLLVIDDEEISRYILRQYLEPQYRVIEASSGPEGLDQARQNGPLVIFLDLTMPETDGFTILAELKQKSETREIPVVIYTSRALDGDERQAFLSQAVGILNKNNISRESVHAALSEALGKHEPSQPEAKNYV
jgi:CheY-like chemotaxis protein